MDDLRERDLHSSLQDTSAITRPHYHDAENHYGADQFHGDRQLHSLMVSAGDYSSLQHSSSGESAQDTCGIQRLQGPHIVNSIRRFHEASESSRSESIAIPFPRSLARIRPSNPLLQLLGASYIRNPNSQPNTPLSDSDKKQILLQGLRQLQHGNWNARRLWKFIKSRGYDIKCAFVGDLLKHIRKSLIAKRFRNDESSTLVKVHRDASAMVGQTRDVKISPATELDPPLDLRILLQDLDDVMWGLFIHPPSLPLTVNQCFLARGVNVGDTSQGSAPKHDRSYGLPVPRASEPANCLSVATCASVGLPSVTVSSHARLVAMTPTLTTVLNVTYPSNDHEKELKSQELPRRVRLIQVVDALLPDMVDWSSLPLDPADESSLDTERRITSLRRAYAPNFAKSEEQVTSDGISSALTLRYLLSLPKSLENIIKVDKQLHRLRCVLDDIGLPRKLIRKIAMLHLKVVQFVWHTLRGEEWILHELFLCAVDCVHWQEPDTNRNQRRIAAELAADSAAQLTSVSPNHSKFYHAVSLHYKADCLLADDHRYDAADALKQSVVSFDKDADLLLEVSSWRRMEMLRAILTYSYALGGPHNDEIAVVCYHTIAQAHIRARNPALAVVLTELAESVFKTWPSKGGTVSYHLLKDALSIVTDAIILLRPLQAIRPSRTQPLLVRALCTRARGVRLQNCHLKALYAIQEGISIQSRLAKSREADEVKYLAALIKTCLVDQLYLRRWKDASTTANRLVELIMAPSGSDLNQELIDCLYLFQGSLQSARDPQALVMARRLIDMLRPIVGRHYSLQLLSALTSVSCTISDIQRGFGTFKAAFYTSREVLAIAKEVSDKLDGFGPLDFIKALACHAHSLVNMSSYDAAALHLRQAIAMWKKSPDLGLSLKNSHPYLWANRLGLFGIVHAHVASDESFSPESLSCLDNIISVSRPVLREPSTFRPLPCWLFPIPESFDVASTDALAWLLLVQTVRNCIATPRGVKKPAMESLALLREYYAQNRACMESFAKASVLGHQYILLIILGKLDEGKSVLNDCLDYYNTLRTSDIARLPLLIFLDILLILSRGIASMKEATSTLQTWKKMTYQGSTLFFDDFAAFLFDLPRFFTPMLQISGAEFQGIDAVNHHGNVIPALAGITFLPLHRRSDNATSRDQTHSKRSSADSRKSRSPTRLSISDKSFDFVGRTVEFTGAGKPHIPKSSRNAHDVPNLTGKIQSIKGPLCAGGFCDVYAGELMNKHGAAPVALKMLRVFNTEKRIVKAKKKFRREVSLWCMLQHPHVLSFYGTCELDEFRLFMVSPWAGGGSALQYLQRYPSTNRGVLLWQVSSALEYLHSGEDAPQIVHGDLKADNVLVSASGDALLCDFGLSRCVEEIISKSRSFSTSRVGGHARFMAPELLKSPDGMSDPIKPTPESDVFAFASLMLQIYTEKLPFHDLPEVPAILKLANGDIPPRPVELAVLERGCNNFIWVLMTDCWKFQPYHRPMKEVGGRLTVEK